MKKNKVFKIIVFVLIALCGIALGISYIIDKDNTTAFVNNIWSWLNQPLPLVGISAFALSLTAIKIFAETSFGRNGLNQIKDELSNHEQSVSKEVEQAKEILTKVQDEKIEQVALLKEYSNEITNIATKLANILTNVPNAKVKNMGHELLNELESTKSRLESGVDEFKDKLGVKDKEESSVDLKQQLANLKAQVEMLEAKYGEKE